jgi:hypothetical protein
LRKKPTDKNIYHLQDLRLKKREMDVRAKREED